MNITIHRGANQIGGCITEISTEGCKVLIDLGSNLPGYHGAGAKEVLLGKYEALMAHGDYTKAGEKNAYLPYGQTHGCIWQRQDIRYSVFCEPFSFRCVYVADWV